MNLLEKVKKMPEARIDSIWIEENKVMGWMPYYRGAPQDRSFGELIGEKKGQEYEFGCWNLSDNQYKQYGKEIWCRAIAPYLNQLTREYKNIQAMLSLGWEVSYWVKATKSWLHFNSVAKIVDSKGCVLFESEQPHPHYMPVKAVTNNKKLEWLGYEGFTCYGDPS
jgi:hypothetical protein